MTERERESEIQRESERQGERERERERKIERDKERERGRKDADKVFKLQKYNGYMFMQTDKPIYNLGSPEHINFYISVSGNTRKRYCCPVFVLFEGD